MKKKYESLSHKCSILLELERGLQENMGCLRSVIERFQLCSNDLEEGFNISFDGEKFQSIDLGSKDSQIDNINKIITWTNLYVMKIEELLENAKEKSIGKEKNKECMKKS